MTNEEILKLIAACRSMVITIAEDYLTADDMRLEMQTAFDNLVDDLSEGPDADTLPDPKVIIDQLTDLYNNHDVKPDEILTLLDTDEIIEYLQDDGYQILKLDYLTDQEKLRDFLSTEIYPFYNQQKENLFL